MTVESEGLVSDQKVETFRRDGVVLLRDVLRPWVEGVQQAIEQNKVNPSWRERTYQQGTGNEAVFFQDYCVW